MIKKTAPPPTVIRVHRPIRIKPTDQKPIETIRSVITAQQEQK